GRYPLGDLVGVTAPSRARWDPVERLGVIALASVQRSHRRVQVAAPGRAVRHGARARADREVAGKRDKVRDLRGRVAADAGVALAGRAAWPLLPAVHLAAIDGGLLRLDGVQHARHDVRAHGRGDHCAVGERDLGGHPAIRAPARVVIAPIAKQVVEGVVFEVEDHDVLDRWPLSGCRAAHGESEEPRHQRAQERDGPGRGAEPSTVSCHEYLLSVLASRAATLTRLTMTADRITAEPGPPRQIQTPLPRAIPGSSVQNLVNFATEVDGSCLSGTCVPICPFPRAWPPRPPLPLSAGPTHAPGAEPPRLTSRGSTHRSPLVAQRAAPAC